MRRRGLGARQPPGAVARRIAAGKNADLFIVHGNPAANINDVEGVIIVFKDGVAYDSAKLIQSVKGRFGEY